MKQPRNIHEYLDCNGVRAGVRVSHHWYGIMDASAFTPKNMHMMNYIKLPTLALCIFLAFQFSLGCAHRQTATTETARYSQADMKYKRVYLDNFTLSPKGVAEDNPKSILDDAEDTCITQLKTSGLFEVVKTTESSDTKDGALIVQSEVTSLRIVSRAARAMLGFMAGSSDMTVRVKLVDAVTGAVISESDVKNTDRARAGMAGWMKYDASLPGRVGALIAVLVVFNAKK